MSLKVQYSLKTVANMIKKNYNYTRRKLYIPEYGRHIHEMVDSLLEIEDRHERTRQAKAVIAVMGNLNPTLRDTADFKHKLWDHLFIMSDFRLDVDSPYVQPSRQDLMISPQKLHYPQTRFIFKHYGKYVQQFLRNMSSSKRAGDATREVVNVARYMRTKSFEYNKEHPNNEVIIRDMRVMVGSDTALDLAAVRNIHSDYRTNNNGARNGKNRKQQRGGGRKPQRNNGKGNLRHNSHK